MAASYQDASGPVNGGETSADVAAFAQLAFAGASVNLTPTVAAIGSLHFEGNVTPHTWYQHPRLRHQDGKANLVAITLLAEICYWYRPTIVTDELTGKVRSVSKKFAADKLHWDHAQRADKFGLTKRQVQEAISFLKSSGLIHVEIREKWALPTGVTLYNQVFIEPDPAAIRDLCGYAPAPAQGVSHPNGTPPPFKRETPPTTMGDPPHPNGTPPPLKREPSTKNTTKTSPETVERSTLGADLTDTGEEPVPEEVRRVIAMTGDTASARRFAQLHRIVLESGCEDAWHSAEVSTWKRLQSERAEPLERPGAYFCVTLLRLLEARGIHVPTGAPWEIAAESAEIRAQIEAGLLGDKEATHAG